MQSKSNISRREALKVLGAASTGILVADDAFAKMTTAFKRPPSMIMPQLSSSFTSVAGRAPDLDIVLCNAWGIPVVRDGEVTLKSMNYNIEPITGSCPKGDLAIAGQNLLPGSYNLKARASVFHTTHTVITLPETPGKALQEKVRMRIGQDDSRAVFASYNTLPEPFHRIMDVSSNNHGEELCNDLTPLQRAGLFNVLSKAVNTILPDGSLVSDHIQNILPDPKNLGGFKIAGDRFFAHADKSLFPLLMEATAKGQFHRQPGLYHTDHSSEYHKIGSFKTRHDPEGMRKTLFNIAVYQHKANGDYLFEGDVDHTGLRHLRHSLNNEQWGRIKSFFLRFNFESEKTHPHDVGQYMAEGGEETYYYLVAA